MGKRSSILIIVEGQRSEEKLLTQLTSEYGLDLEYEIYSYRTNIHDLYRRIFLDDEIDAKDIDLLGTLRERENDPQLRSLLYKDYSDILLVFDYDPHDNRFSPHAIMRMIEHFSESTDAGKLYVNYPMLESYKHFASIPDPCFNQRAVELKNLSRYKEIVDRESFCTDTMRYGKTFFDIMIASTVKKACVMLSIEKFENNMEAAYNAIDHAAILERQNQLVSERSIVMVLCTCLFFICDYNPHLVNPNAWLLSNEDAGLNTKSS